MRVLFWGTPEFAAPPLRALLGEGHEVVGVVTQPDRPHGRHRSTVVPSPIKVIAVDEGLLVLQPERPRGDAFLDRIRELQPDVSVVVAYGHMLPRAAIDLPASGTLNIHASLLPRWRGAAPIQAAIRAGDSETGVTVMRMVDRMDAGPILLQAPTPIEADETFGELQLRLSELGALAIMGALTLRSLGAATEVEQDESLATYAPKIDRSQLFVDWSRSGDEVSRTIRAFDPRPGAVTVLRDIDVKLFGARSVTDVDGDCGTVVRIDEAGMLVACGRGGVRCTLVHPSGGRRLAALDWAQGRGVRVGDVFDWPR
ncbi:MAG: Methionyl-tRNA formyltransferase [Gemmatimonadaceae bacterium]|nr:Methionyl-tRNA formyltransferase [Gemmatimonadaceae bacterium]